MKLPFLTFKQILINVFKETSISVFFVCTSSAHLPYSMHVDYESSSITAVVEIGGGGMWGYTLPLNTFSDLSLSQNFVSERL